MTRQCASERDGLRTWMFILEKTVFGGTCQLPLGVRGASYSERWADSLKR